MTDPAKLVSDSADAPNQAFQHLYDVIQVAWEHGISGLHCSVGSAPSCRKARSFLTLDQMIREGPNAEKARALLSSKLDRQFFESIYAYWQQKGAVSGALSHSQVSIDGDRYWRARVDLVPYNYANGTVRPDKSLFMLEIRILEHTPVDFSDLSYPAQFFETINQRPSGVVLIGGLASSGRSTTMASLVLKLAQSNPGLNIASLESPIEYILRSQAMDPTCRVVQTEVMRNRGAWFHELSSVSRRDFNIVMISEVNPALPTGEVLDFSDIMLEMAGNGSRVISTVSAVDFWTAFKRFTHRTDPAVQRVVRESAIRHLIGIVVQQLVTVVDPTTKWVYPQLHCGAMLFSDQLRMQLLNALSVDGDTQLRNIFENANRTEASDGSRSLVASREALRTNGVDVRQLFLGMGTFGD